MIYYLSDDEGEEDDYEDTRNKQDGENYGDRRVELLIVGGGPAGTAAGIVCRSQAIKNHVLVAEAFGGQSIVSPDIKNWIGTPSISGPDLAELFKKHLQEYEGENIFLLLKVSG